MIETYSVKIEVKKDNKYSKFLKKTEFNAQKRKKKLIHIRGFLNKKPKDMIEFVCFLISQGVPKENIVIAYDGMWCHLYLIKKQNISDGIIRGVKINHEKRRIEWKTQEIEENIYLILGVVERNLGLKIKRKPKFDKENNVWYVEIVEEGDYGEKGN